MGTAGPPVTSGPDGGLPESPDPCEHLASGSAAFPGGERLRVEAGREREIDRPRGGGALRDDHRRRDAEDVAGAAHGVPGVEARVVGEDVLGGDAGGQRGVAHRVGLVVLEAGVVAGHQELLHPSGAVEADGRVDALPHDGAQRPVRAHERSGHDRHLHRPHRSGDRGDEVVGPPDDHDVRHGDHEREQHARREHEPEGPSCSGHRDPRSPRLPSFLPPVRARVPRFVGPPVALRPLMTGASPVPGPRVATPGRSVPCRSSPG